MSEVTRRTVLAGAAGAGAAAVLAGCGGSGSNSTGSTGGGSTPTAAGSTQAGSGGNTLGRKEDIPVGGGKVFDQQKVVVTQPAAGDFKAFTAICTHMGCTVATVQNGTINCPCHGSQYSITDGSVKAGPAPRPLAAKTVTVSGDNIVLG